MPDIAASNVTVTVLQRAYMMDMRKRHRVKIAFGDGALTYPSGGVPMPAAGTFGMSTVVESMTVTDDDDGQGIFNKYDAEAKKIRIWFPTQQTAGTGNRAGVEYTGGTTAVPATTLYAIAEGW